MPGPTVSALASWATTSLSTESRAATLSSSQAPQMQLRPRFFAMYMARSARLRSSSRFLASTG